uniref:Thioredoxin domain-containing protein n=1 Tax=Gouania willdenowi TaxID=441366 RepID=A0A8C5HSH8_GOUWI
MFTDDFVPCDQMNTVISLCSCAKNVVTAARPPVRFFSPEAPVVDLYFGQLDQVERLRSMAEVSLIFFYAPWCAHSLAARQEVQQVAMKLAKQVQFVAINCWWIQGKCRRQNHFYQYPVIHLFYRRFGPIEYNGPFVAPYVESFILKVITPLTYLPSRTHLEAFLSYHEPGVVGFFQFNASPQPPGYITYLSSALQALKRDFRGAVRFGVVTNRQVADAIPLKEDKTIYLHRRLNSSLIFPQGERNFTSEAICSWVFEHHETFLTWLHPPRTKSHLLEKELSKGPALLLFLPHNPLDSEPSAALQQETTYWASLKFCIFCFSLFQVADIAVSYHTCSHKEDSSLDSSVTSSLCCHSVVLPNSNKNVCEICRSLIADPIHYMLFIHLRHCCLHQLPSPLSTKTVPFVGCSDFLSSYSPFGQYSACCREKEPQHNHSQAKEESDGQRFPSPPSSLIPLLSDPQQEHDGITGLRCLTNRTLRFYVLDAALNWPLAMGLGAPGNSSTSGECSDGSFVTIVNLKDETHYVLHRSPADTLKESLETFIRNFSAPYSLLQRHLRTPQRLITELTTSSFRPCVMDIEKDVLLFYYTHWCGFCSALNHIIILLARLLQANSSITVARVNVARNDLPWEFMVDRVPSILLFPRYRKHLSVKFPEALPITLPNLVHFILQHSDSLRYADKLAAVSHSALLHTEVLSLQQEVKSLHRAHERLSQQLAQLWRDSSVTEKSALQEEMQFVEEQYQEKSRQLGEAVRKQQELADASHNLLNDNTALDELLRTLTDRTGSREQEHTGRGEGGEKRNHGSHVAFTTSLLTDVLFLIEGYFH